MCAGDDISSLPLPGLLGAVFGAFGALASKLPDSKVLEGNSGFKMPEFLSAAMPQIKMPDLSGVLCMSFIAFQASGPTCNHMVAVSQALSLHIPGFLE